jgi:pseudouridine-5'-phosphate glycosidase
MAIALSTEVEQALADGLPVVALESSVIAQGLPHPRNVEAARACEDAVRESAAIPATMAVLGGAIRVGLGSRDVAQLVELKERARKIGARDLAAAVTQKASGGMTVSAVCQVAASLGIRVFATGGMGGVHRGVGESWDVSQDLWALSTHPVALICAGAKAILDLPKTMEALESLGVPVIGVGTDEFPAFYSADSGLKLEHRVDAPMAAAQLMHVRFNVLRQNGMVFALAPPEASAMRGEEVERYLSVSLAAASQRKLVGKALTPFLLAEMVRLSGGRALTVNLELLVQNARFAGQLAKAHVQLSHTAAP